MRKYIDADNTSNEIATPSGQAKNLTFEEYLRGVFEINNGIENDPDNLVRIHAPELLKLARKQKQPEVGIDIKQELYHHFGQVKDFTLGVAIASYFYELGQCNAIKEE